MDLPLAAFAFPDDEVLAARQGLALEAERAVLAALDAQVAIAFELVRIEHQPHAAARHLAPEFLDRLAPDDRALHARDDELRIRGERTRRRRRIAVRERVR